MFSSRIRYIFMLLGLLVMLYFLYHQNYQAVIIITLYLAYNIWSYLRNGPVFLAFKELRSDNIGKAEKLLKEIRRPEWLRRSQQAYYHFCWGYVHMKQAKLAEADISFVKALETGLRSENDKALSLLNLSWINWELGYEKKARELLAEAGKKNYPEHLEEEFVRLHKLFKA